ncbi:Hint domain-containing protein [Aestuariicoccus sp. MJ-SS9]|uniref:Hint domain-containing protein n=1 Tax=Aestuariicoccus sp. MJ-SS9 TaxID=3079855 RepID=UPI00291365E3|nr:Hint domain-containing protein [Aestuariicoccus sp. MJ-SS9]MDU8909677.1 Hint domain-containing protein [Aestuariicoccus sp. MJ-SS9]
MRKYEAAALLPDLSISHTTHVAPATPLFEETACAFARGTLVDTVRGPVAIEDLLPGDYVETDQTPEPVMWIGSTSYVPGKTDQITSLTQLTRITSDAFGMGRPGIDILAGPAARMIVRRDRLQRLIGQSAVLVPVADYTDGDRIFDITPGGPVQLYHLMLRRHAAIRVGGIEMETYHPGKALSQPMGQNIRALFLSMFQNIDDIPDFGELAWPRTRREVIDGLTG